MIIIIISVVAFVIMLLFPILFSLFFLQKNYGKVLKIEHSKIKDPRYFVKSFTGLFDQKWADYDGSGKITLSREENILESDTLSVYPSVFNSIIYAENHDFRSKQGIRFEKEVYARQNAFLSGMNTVRAICSKKNLVLGNGTRVLRWADAEGTLTAFNGCDLGISATSKTKIIIGSNCNFRRLYAPVIMFEQTPGYESPKDNHSQNIVFKPIALNKFRNIKYVSDDLADDIGVLASSIITVHDITVLDNLTVKGHIRSHRGIRICDNAIVYGNLFAERDIYIGQNARVYGSIFTQGNLYTECGVTIGQLGKIKSVIAREKIIFEKNCCVYGYVSSEAGGECCPDYNSRKKDMGILSALFLRRGNQPNKLLPVVITLAVLMLVITTSVTAKSILLKVQEKEKMLERQVMARELTYGPDGKTNGEELETIPVLITEDYVYFKDRVLERFHYHAEDTLQTSEILRGVMDSLPEGVNKYLMIVPTRIRFENDVYQLYSDNVDDAINEIYNRMPSDVITIDAMGELLKHKDEYLFFRTDHQWTALGAYYAAAEYSKNAGIEMKKNNEYREYRMENFLGSMNSLPNAQELNKYPDYVSYFILEGAVNDQTITSRRSRDEYITYDSPTIAASRQGNDIFIGSYYSHSILHGDAKNGKTLMILGDEYSKALAPWLTPYYENVFLVSPEFFDGDYQKFWQLFSEYRITDFLVIEYSRNIGDSVINTRLRDLFSKPQDNS